MSSLSNRFLAGVTIASLLIFALPSFAATIKVVEDGEGGGAMRAMLRPSKVRAGPSVFLVSNEAATANHQMIVMRLKSKNAVVPFNKAKHRVDESQLESLGKVGHLFPGEKGRLKVNLTPGTYLVFCNYKGHYEAGMAAKLTVIK